MLFRSSEEVAEVIEKDVEEHLARNPTTLSKRLRLKARQLPLSSGRVDLLFQAPRNELLLVEVKLGKIGRDAVSQVEGYLAELRASHHGPVRGAIVCAGVMPAFEEDIRRKKAIRILVYGWNLQVQTWEAGPA
jgi:RecB family endonuclease NucS